jgi:uncharacterized cupin superfamily protein
MGWSKKNLHDVKDYAVDFGLDETQEAHFGRKDLDLEATGFNYLVVKPGRREAFGHRHSQAEEVIVVLDGEGRLKLDDDIIDLAPFDVVRVGPTVTRRLEAADDGLQVLVFGPHVEGDGETVPGFWED